MMRHSVLWIALALAVGGCASVPDREAVESISEARASIEQAVRADAGLSESQAMFSARQKLDAADRALNDGDEEEAVRLAEEAKADAAYAAAAARQEKATTAVNELEEAIRTLRAETAGP